MLLCLRVFSLCLDVRCYNARCRGTHEGVAETCVVYCEQAWAILEAERGNTDHARRLLRSASEKDPCDLYIWQVCAWGPGCAHVPACNTTWPIQQTRGTGVQRASTVPCPNEQQFVCVR